MGYKLADGSDSELYEVGDTFLVAESDYGSDLKVGFVVQLDYSDPKDPIFTLPSSRHQSIPSHWSNMRPTAKTIADVKKRNRHAQAVQNFNLLQQPCIPIQFIWHDGYLYRESDTTDIGMAIDENCEVEQIGAVLYVRGKE